MTTHTLLLGPLAAADLVALTILIVAWWVIGWLSEHPPTNRPPSVGVLMEGYRREWMRQFVTRQLGFSTRG